MVVAVSAVVLRTGVIRCGRIHTGMAIWTTAKMASVMAMAGTVRRMMRPISTPRVNANAAYPMGVMPRAPNSAGKKRLSKPPTDPSQAAWSMGLAHQPRARLSSPASAMLVSPSTPSLTASQRSRVTLWFQASRNEPLSSSRAISGAPQNRPITAGSTMISAAPRI